MKESTSADESASLGKDLTGYTGTMVIQSPEKMDVVPVGSNIATSSSPKPKGANKSKREKKKKKPPPLPPPKNVVIKTVTLKDLRQGMKVSTADSQRQLLRVPSKVERLKLYKDAESAISAREVMSLAGHGGRPWRCYVRMVDRDTTKQKTKKRSSGPLFRWFRGKLELACLPHLLEKIPITESALLTVMKKRSSAPSISDDDDDDDDSNSNGNSSEDEDSDCSSSEEEEEPVYLAPKTDLSERVISSLSTMAWTDPDYPIPTLERRWISPDQIVFTSRTKALEHASELIKRDKMIDKVLFGFGARGVQLRPSKPTKAHALQAGKYRFERDGLWVVGQEEEWQEDRAERIIRKEKRETKRLAKVSKKAKKVHESKAISQSDGSSTNETTESNDTPSIVISSTIDCIAPSKKIYPLVLGGNSNDESSEDAMTVIPSESVSESTTTTKTTTVDGDIIRSGGDSLNPKPVPDVSAQICTSTTSTVSVVESSQVVVSRKRGPPGPPRRIKASSNWRMNEAQIALCYSAILEHYENVMNTVKARALHSELADGFDVFRERGRGRYDMELPVFDTPQFDFLNSIEKAPWMPIVRQILGEDVSLIHKGAFLSLPGSEAQVYHQDGVHLNKTIQKPCHAVNVFIPLVDLMEDNGPTEFCLGTHYLGYEGWMKEMLETPLPVAGAPVIFDYRLGHRGMGNSSTDCRPIVYCTYAPTSGKKDFRDSVNFSRKRYHRLGDLVEKPLSREERAQLRRQRGAKTRDV